MYQNIPFLLDADIFLLMRCRNKYQALLRLSAVRITPDELPLIFPIIQHPGE